MKPVKHQINYYRLTPKVLVILACTAAAAWPARRINSLVHIEWSGGECPTGPCSTKAEIDPDGSYVKDGVKIGKVDASDLAELTKQIHHTDFAALKAVPFQGTCPTAYDGQKAIYTFMTSHGIQILDSCVSAIDLQSRPFKLLYRLLTPLAKT